MRQRGLILAALWVSLAIPAAAQQKEHVWLDADGAPLPFQSHPEILDFLQHASVASRRSIGIGTTDASKLVLERDGVRAHAVFRDVNVTKRNLKLGRQVVPYFRDYCQYEVAAYYLSQKLGFNRVPPTVLRRVGNRSGSVQLWVEKAIMEKERADQKLEFPPPGRRMFMWQAMYLFDSLIYNDDRNQGNILYDPEEHLWMIDHTRSFRLSKQPRNLQLIRYCTRDVLEGLRTLQESELRADLDGVLTEREITALLERRDLIVKHVEELIKKRGEEAVFFND